MRAAAAVRAQLHDGLGAIRRELHVPGPHDPAVTEAADAAIARGPTGAGRRDVTDLPFVTLDPASSTDLDQAFHLATDGDDVVLHYAIADVSAWVTEGDPLTTAALIRGATTYLPDGASPLYPPALSHGAASLLPDGPRPAVLLTVRLPPDGIARLAAAERVTVRSRAKLAYETATDADLPAAALLREAARRVEAAEEARGAVRIEFPEPVVVATADGGLELRAERRHPNEDLNATLSLAANLAVADRLLAAATGLFRVMPDPPAERLRSLRRTARALGIPWDRDTTVRQLNERLDPTDARQAFLLRSIRRAAGGATYAPFAPGVRPWHSAVAATYAHATAPLRRLADRYVLDLVVAVHAGERPGVPVPLARLPAVMEQAEARQSQVDGAVTDLVEAVMLAGRVGEVFAAAVVDAEGDSARVQLADPPVRARITLDGATPGDPVTVRLTGVDVDERRVRFEPGRARTGRGG